MLCWSCVLESGRDMLLDKRKPIDLSCTSLCARGSTETPRGLTDRQ